MRVVSTAFASLSVDDAESVGMQAGEAGPSGDASAAVPAAAAKGRKKKKVDEGKKKKVNEGTAMKDGIRHGGQVQGAFQAERKNPSQLVFAIQHPNPPALFGGKLQPLPFDKPTNEGLTEVGQQQPPRPYTEESRPYGKLSTENRRIQMLYMRGTHATERQWQKNRDTFDCDGAAFELFKKPYKFLGAAEQRVIRSKQLAFARSLSVLAETLEPQVALTAERNKYAAAKEASRKRAEDYESGVEAAAAAEGVVDDEMGDADAAGDDASAASATDDFGPGGRFETEEDKALRLGLNEDNELFMKKVEENQKRLQAANPVVSIDGTLPQQLDPLELFYSQAFSETVQQWTDKTEEEMRHEIQVAAAIGDLEAAEAAAEQLRIRRGLTRSYEEQFKIRKRQGRPVDPASVWKALGRSFDERKELPIRAKADTLRDLSYRLTGLFRSENLQYYETSGTKGQDKTTDLPLMRKSDFPDSTNLGYTQHKRRIKDAVKYPYLDSERLARYKTSTPDFMVSDRTGDTSKDEQQGNVEVVWFATLQDRAKGVLNVEYLDPETTVRELDYMSTAMHSHTPATARQRLPAVWNASTCILIEKDWKQGGKYHGKIAEYEAWEKAAEAAKQQGQPIPDMPLLTPPYPIFQATNEEKQEGVRRPRFARAVADLEYGTPMDYATVRKMADAGVLGINSVGSAKFYARQEKKYPVGAARGAQGTTFYVQNNHSKSYVLTYALYPADKFHAMRENEPTELNKMHHRSQIENEQGDQAVQKLRTNEAEKRRLVAQELRDEQRARFDLMEKAEAAEAGPVEKTQADLERAEAIQTHAIYPVAERFYTETVEEMWKKVLQEGSKDVPGPAIMPSTDEYPFYMEWLDETWMHPGYDKDGMRFEEKDDYEVRLAVWVANRFKPDALPWRPVRHEASYYRYVRLVPGRDALKSEQTRKFSRSAAVPDDRKEPWGARPVEDADDWGNRQSEWNSGAGEFIFILFQEDNPELVTAIMQQAAVDRAAEEQRRVDLLAEPERLEEEARKLRGEGDREIGDPPSPERQRSRD